MTYLDEMDEEEDLWRQDPDIWLMSHDFGRPEPDECDWCERPFLTAAFTGGDSAPRLIRVLTTTMHGPNRIMFTPYYVCSATCYAEYIANLRDENPEWQREQPS